MIKLGNAVLGAAGVALLTIGVAAQTGSIRLPFSGGGATVAGRPSNAPPPASPSPLASPSPSPSPPPAPQVLTQVGGGGPFHHQKHKHGG